LRLGYGLDNWNSIAGGDNYEIFSLRHRVKTGYGAHLPSYLMGTEDSLPGDEANYSAPSSSDVKNAWSYTSTPPNTSSRRGA